MHPDPAKKYIVYMDASDDVCGAQLSHEHDGTELPVAFLSHTFTETKEVEYPRTGNLWSILHYNQMELLPPRIQYHSPQQPQTISQIP